jgi:hypothetical protein
MKALSTLERQERSLALDGKKALHGKEHRAETALCGKEHGKKKSHTERETSETLWGK